MDLSEHLQTILDTIPHKTGCYLMKDGDGKVIYVGKAVDLRHRVRSYFHASAQSNPRTAQLVRHIQDIDWIIVQSELEALILEMNLIKEYQPHFNVRLKDDKRYPYIKIHWQDPFPKVTVTRQVKRDGSRYFGPYTSVWAVDQTLDVLRRVFPYLTCNRTITGEDQRACLYYDIALCSAPCIGEISQKAYREMIGQLADFLDGRTEPIVDHLQKRMDQASSELRFEEAGQIRDQLIAIERIVEEQRIISTEYKDSDVLAIHSEEDEACVQVFFIRGGKLTGREYFLVEGTENTPEKDVLAEVIKQFYDQAPSVPPQILLPREVEEARIIQKWLDSKRGGDKVKMRIPHSAEEEGLIEMAAENAAEMLAAHSNQEKAIQERSERALDELQSHLDLPAPPARIECYDISNTQGAAQVGSMVVFEDGSPQKSHYRRFNIRSVSGPDDYASMEEVISRRFRRWRELIKGQGQPGYNPDPSFSTLPDLLLVDGGKGQLNRSLEVIEEFDLQDAFTVAGLAKQNEDVYLPGQSRPVRFDRNSAGLHLLQRVRDEAHRFAIASHRKRRSRKGLQSSLEKIPGVGPARRRALLNKFHTIQNIRQASLKELASTPKIHTKLAQTIKEHLD